MPGKPRSSARSPRAPADLERPRRRRSRQVRGGTLEGGGAAGGAVREEAERPGAGSGSMTHREAFTILEDAVRRCRDEDMRTADVDAALDELSLTSRASAARARRQEENLW